MAFPTITATNTTNGTTASANQVVNLPATVNAGETLLVFLRSAGASGNGVHTYPAGWTKLFDIGSIDQTSMAWKKADGTEGGTTITITVTGGNTKFAALSWSIAGATDPTVTPPEDSAAASGNSTSPDPAIVTPTGGAKDYLWLAVMGIQGEQTSPPTFPANYTISQIAADSGVAGLPTTNVRVAGAKRTDLNAASEDPGAFTVSAADEWRAFAVAVHPAGAAEAMTVDKWGQPIEQPYPDKLGVASY